MNRKKTGKRFILASFTAAAGMAVLLLTACATPRERLISDAKKETQAKEIHQYIDAATRNIGKDESGGDTISLNADYVEIVNENQHRNLYLSTEQWFDGGGQPRSEAIDQGSYYEVTHGRILGDTCYALSMMDGKGAGDTLQLEDTVYRITGVETWCLENGENVQLEHVSGPDEGYFMLVHNDSGDYYTLIGPNAETKKDILYTGSLYFSKDCLTMTKDPENNLRDHTVPISDYLTKTNESVGSQSGLSSGRLVLWGNFEIDSSGLIIRYAEHFLP